MRTEIRRAKRAASPLETRVVAMALGLFAVVSFLVCIVWSLVTPGRLHMEAFLEQVLPAFEMADAEWVPARPRREFSLRCLRRARLLPDLHCAASALFPLRE